MENQNKGLKPGAYVRVSNNQYNDVLFGGTKQCPKCGRNRTWRVGQRQFDGFRIMYQTAMTVIDDVYAEDFCEHVGIEYMLVTCDRCGFSWTEIPLDRTEQIKSPEHGG